MNVFLRSSLYKQNLKHLHSGYYYIHLYINIYYTSTSSLNIMWLIESWIMNLVIYNNDTLFQCTRTDNNDDKKNSIYTWLIKNKLYNFIYKLRSVSGREDDITTNKWTWFDIQVPTTLLWTWVVSQALVDYTKTRRFIGCLLDTVQALSVSGTDSSGTITSLAVYPGGMNV